MDKRDAGAGAETNIVTSSEYITLPHGLGLIKKVRLSDAEATKRESLSSTVKDGSVKHEVVNEDDFTDEIENVDKNAALSNSVQTHSHTRYFLRERKVKVKIEQHQNIKKTQNRLRLKLIKSFISEQVDDDASHQSLFSETSVTISSSVQKTRRRNVPKKERTPYHKNSTVPWGETPYPDHRGPAAPECEHVFRLLKEQHASGKLSFVRPAKIPPPSLEIAGCGESQLLIDGLARTVLSGSTSMKNADNAIQQVVEYYGTITKSIVVDGEEITPVRNCIDWDRVRREGERKFGQVIKCGGLQNVGSKAVLSILEKTYMINTERTAAFLEEKKSKTPAVVPGSEALTQSQKDMEVWMHQNNVLSLEHLRALPVEMVMNELVQFHGVGIKTAACVILFCLQEPCFAVDTHCFRIPQWLGWIPAHLNENSDRGKAFAHLDLRIPDDLKYGLHQLFIEHGQNCYRCKASTREGTKAWEECICPLEELLDRSISKQGKKGANRKRKAADLEVPNEEKPADGLDRPESSESGSVTAIAMTLAPHEKSEHDELICSTEEKQKSSQGRRKKVKVEGDEDTKLLVTKAIGCDEAVANTKAAFAPSVIIPSEHTQGTVDEGSELSEHSDAEFDGLVFDSKAPEHTGA